MSEEVIQTKMCRECKQSKILTQFNKCATSKFGVAVICKDCKKYYNRQRYLNKIKGQTQTAYEQSVISLTNIFKSKILEIETKAKKLQEQNDIYENKMKENKKILKQLEANKVFLNQQAIIFEEKGI